MGKRTILLPESLEAYAEKFDAHFVKIGAELVHVHSW